MGKYSETLMQHFQAPQNSGPMESPDLVGHAGTPGRGPFFILYLRMEEGRVSRSSFQAHGCGPTIASGSVLTQAIAGLSAAECLRLTAGDVIEALDGVPADKLHGPALAIAALRDALNAVTDLRDQPGVVPGV